MQGLSSHIAGRRSRRTGAYAEGGIMGGALGFALGTALNAAAVCQGKAQKERQHDDFLLPTYQASSRNGSIAGRPAVSEEEIRH